MDLLLPSILILVCLLALILALLLVIQISVIRKYSRRQEDELAKDKKDLQNFEKTIADSQKDASIIIEQAEKESQSIISNTKIFTEKERELIVSKLNLLVDEGTQNIKSTFDETNKLLMNKISGISIDSESIKNDINKNVMTQLTNFSNSLNSQVVEITTHFRDSLSQISESRKAELEKSIEEYKELRMKEIDTKISEVMDKLFSNVLRKSLTKDDHKNLILSSMEEAKKMKMFD